MYILFFLICTLLMGIHSLALNTSTEKFFTEPTLADYLKAHEQFPLDSKQMQTSTCRQLSLCIYYPMENTVQAACAFNQNSS